MTDYHGDIVDRARSACLCDVDGPGLMAATAVGADGSTHLIVVQLDRLGDDTALYDPACVSAEHEQLGELPLEFVKRITISERTRRHDNPETAP